MLSNRGLCKLQNKNPCNRPPTNNHAEQSLRTAVIWGKKIILGRVLIMALTLCQNHISYYLMGLTSIRMIYLE